MSIGLTNVANAKAEPWGACSQLEQKKIFDSKPFHCIKTARGNFVFVPTSLPNGSAIDQGTATKLKVDKIIDPIVAKAFVTYDHNACKSGHSNFSANYLSSPNYSPQMLQKQKVLFEEAMSCYNNYFDRKVTINIALSTDKDYEFMASQTTNGKSVFDETKLRWIKFMMERIGQGAGRFAGSAGWSKNTDSAWVIMIDSTKSTFPDAHGAAHEFVHILQSYSKSGLFETYEDDSPPATFVNLPKWFWEGTAELFSYAEISPSVGNFSANMSVAGSEAKDAPSMNKINTNDQVPATLKKIEAPSDQDANKMSYALGRELSQFILVSYGYNKYIQIMKNSGKYPDFNENLKSVIGIGKDELYAKAAPFILGRWKPAKF